MRTLVTSLFRGCSLGNRSATRVCFLICPLIFSQALTIQRPALSLMLKEAFALLACVDTAAAVAMENVRARAYLSVEGAFMARMVLDGAARNLDRGASDG